MLKYLDTKGVSMTYFWPTIFATIMSFSVQANECTERKQTLANQYQSALVELKSLPYTKKNGEKVIMDTLAHDFYSDLRYFERNLNLILSKKEKALIQNDPKKALINSDIISKLRKSADILDLELKIDEKGELFVCSSRYTTKKILMGFCDFLKVPGFRPIHNNWSDENYIQDVFFIHNSKDKNNTKKIFHGVDLGVSSNLFIKKNSSAECLKSQKESKRMLGKDVMQDAQLDNFPVQKNKQK